MGEQEKGQGEPQGEGKAKGTGKGKAAANPQFEGAAEEMVGTEAAASSKEMQLSPSSQEAVEKVRARATEYGQGCGRCQYKSCNLCCPEKAIRYWLKKEGKL